jgi:hypothetical protein
VGTGGEEAIDEPKIRTTSQQLTLNGLPKDFPGS